MTTGNLIRVATRSIAKNKMRSLLTTLGIIIGVSAVIVMIAIGSGAQAKIQEQIMNLGTNMLVVTPGSSNQGNVRGGAGTFNRLTVDDAETLARESTLLSAVSPVIMTFGHIVAGGQNWRAPVYGVSTEYQQIRDWPTQSGVFFDSNDQRSMRKVAVLGSTVASEIFPDQDPVGQQMLIRNVPVTVIGVLATKGQSATGSDQDDVVLMPYTTVQTRLAGHQFIAQILASTYSAADIPAAQNEITTLMRDSHRLAGWEEDDFTVRNQGELAEAQENTTKVMTLLLASIAGISLLVGGIGIMNMMLVSVTERTREIGIRMALGARGSDVLTQFLVESIVISLLGGFLGLVLGFAASAVVGRVTGWITVISPTTVVVALAFSAGVGIFFGFYPARKAAALNPIEALRYE